MVLSTKNAREWIWLNRHRLVRVPWRIVIYLIFLLLCTIIGTILFSPFLPDLKHTEINGLAASYFALSIPIYAVLSLVIFAASAVMVKLFDKRPVSSIGLGFHPRWKTELLAGILLGAGFIIIVVIALILFGAVRLVPSGIETGTLSMYFLLYLLFFTSVSFVEELAFRGYLLQVLAEGIGKVWAILLISTLFGAVHTNNTGGTLAGAISTGFAGVVLSIAYFRTLGLWLPIGIHLTWNFVMGCIFSLPVSGETIADTPFTATLRGPDWLTGGSFGPEGSILTLIMMAILVVFLLKSRHTEASPEAIAMHPPPEERTLKEESATIQRPE